MRVRGRWSAAPRAEGHQLTGVTIAGASLTVSHDPGGRVDAAGDHTYTWDALGRLLAVHDAAGNHLEGYAYTVDGRLAATIDASGAFTSQLLWEGGELAAAYTATLAVVPATQPGTSNLTTSYVYTPLWEAAWGPGPRRLLEWWHADEPGPRILIEDARRSVAAITEPGEDTISHRLDYGPDGALTVRDSAGQLICQDGATPCQPPAGLPFAFGSTWRSPTTGLSWMGHRWMSPTLHQFLGPDPLGYIDAFDPYAYAAFDPINGWDPWGQANQGFADRDTGWVGAAWNAWGFMQGIAPPGVDMLLEALVDPPLDKDLRADFVDGKRSGAIAGVLASGVAVNAGVAAQNTLPAAGAACAAGGVETGGLACAPMAIPMGGVAVAVAGAAGVGYYGAKLEGMRPAEPLQMSAGGGSGGAGSGASSPTGASKQLASPVDSTLSSTARVSGSAPHKSGSTLLGHSLQKHGTRNPRTWAGGVSGPPSTCHAQADRHLRDIIEGPGAFQRITNRRGITFLEKRLPDGRGLRLNLGRFNQNAPRAIRIARR